VKQGAFVHDGRIFFRDHSGQKEIMLVSEIPLKGGHNVENVLAAVCVGALLRCEPDRIRKTVHDFKAVEHRLEYVATIRGVEYYNDSKATNVDATIKALESFPANIHLILGGKDKGSDYTVLNDLLRQRVKRVYTIGAAAAKIESQIKGAAEIDHAETLETAIQHAAEAAKPGDVVLLAPACASFDQFRNYEHRGKVFKQVVKALVEQANQKS
jgi:UDP-N-acetylmuramoylalanine--D-glutamate ligase